PSPIPPRSPPPVVETNFLVEATAPSSLATPFASDGIVSPLAANRFRRPPQQSWTPLIVVCLLVLIGCGLIVAFILFRGQLLGTKDRSQSDGADSYKGNIRNLKNTEEKVFRVLAPQSVWQMDSDLRAGLKATLALRRNDSSDAWLAVGAKDYGTRKPR